MALRPARDYFAARRLDNPMLRSCARYVFTQRGYSRKDAREFLNEASVLMRYYFAHMIVL